MEQWQSLALILAYGMLPRPKTPFGEAEYVSETGGARTMWMEKEPLHRADSQLAFYGVRFGLPQR